MESEATPLVRLEGIQVRYGSLTVLGNLHFSLVPGEIHAIVGEHGAGKSTLARVIAGAIRPSAGRVSWEGRQRAFFNRDIARNLGIEFVAQETSIFRHQSVAFNLLVNRKSLFPGPLFSPHRNVEEAERYLARMGVSIPARALMEGLALPDRVLIDILSCLYAGPRLLILDEALEKLSAEDLARVRPLLRGIARSGGCVLVITHRIDDMYNLADSLTILRAGKILMTDRVRNIDKVSVIKLAYTQIMSRPEAEDMNEEFHHFLKYNEAVLEHLPVSLVIVDRNGKIKMYNRRAQEFFDLPQVPAGERGIELLFRPEEEDAIAAVSAAIERRVLDCAYGMRLRKGKGDRTVDFTYNPIFDGDHFIGSMLIFNDITEQEELRAGMILSEKLAAVGLLSAGVAHEINNPLETICNSVDFLKMKVTEEKQARALSRIEGEVAAIGHIVGNLMAFSGRNRSPEERFDLGELLSETVSLLRYNARFSGTEIVYCGPDSPLEITAVRTEIRQVFLNLIKNGLEAMPDGGNLEVLLRREHEGDQSWAVGIVEDRGTGLGTGTGTTIFLPFFSTKSGAEGHMGLGLSISYGIINKLGGSIAAENIEPRGCRFTVRIPACG